MQQKTFRLGLWGWVVLLINVALGCTMIAIHEPWGIANLVFAGLMVGLSLSNL